MITAPKIAPTPCRDFFPRPAAADRLLFTFGEYDFFTIGEAPSETQMAAALIAAGVAMVSRTCALAMSSAESEGAFAAAGDLALRTPEGTWWDNRNAGDQTSARVAERAGNRSGQYSSENGPAFEV